MKLFEINKGQIVIIDDEDFGHVVQYRWRRHPGQVEYVVRSEYDGVKQRTVFLHREIMGEPKGFVVDHINGNTLDNRKSNLRACTPAENSRNRKISRNNTSGAKGVTFNKADIKFVAYIYINGENKHLGCFDNLCDASNAYNDAAKIYHGQFARFN